MAAWTKVEADLAAVLVADLRDRGWVVYQEVDVAGSIADVYAMRSARAFGIGVLEVHGGDRSWEVNTAREVERPAFLRRCSTRVRSRLRVEQQTYAVAGNAAGKRWSPFQATCEAIRDTLRYGPMDVSTLVKALHGKHHYASEASAKGSIRTWAAAGKIEGVEVVDGKPGPSMLRLTVKP